MSTSVHESGSAIPSTPDAWPELPTETEIYILPDGQVVVADMPVELAAVVTDIGQVTQGQAGHDASKFNKGPGAEPNQTQHKPDEWRSVR